MQVDLVRMQRILAVLIVGFLAVRCSAQQRKLLHGGHAHEEEATAPAAAAPNMQSSAMHTEYTGWLDYVNKMGHESPMDFVLDSLGAVGTVDKANVSELLYVVGNSQ